jgi:hypothetical protein
MPPLPPVTQTICFMPVKMLHATPGSAGAPSGWGKDLYSITPV